MSKLSKERYIKKWAPIMDSLKITDSKKREFLSEYAEHHQEIDAPRQTIWDPNPSHIGNYHKKISKITHPDIDPYGEENWDEDVSEQSV